LSLPSHEEGLRIPKCMLLLPGSGSVAWGGDGQILPADISAAH
jgi:hypothetical protein